MCFLIKVYNFIPHVFYVSVYIALAHYHAAKSINTNVDEGSLSKKPNSFIFDDSSLNGDVCPNSLKLAHIQESMACHEESQRLQRMCRDLKVLFLFRLN